jgi:hypothetical protein
VSVLDYGPFKQRQLHEFVRETSVPHHAEGLFHNIPENVTQRLIITLLVANFGVTPDVFEDHLINSRYGGARYNNANPGSWKTLGTKKSYV